MSVSLPGARVYAYRRGPQRAKKKRDNPEHRAQVAIATYLRFALPKDWRFTASAAGVPLGPKLAKEMKEAGQERGWTDLILRQKGTGETRWLECKAPGGSLEPEQKAFRDECPQHWALARTPAEAEKALLFWGIKPRCSLAQANRYALPDDIPHDGDLA